MGWIEKTSESISHIKEGIRTVDISRNYAHGPFVIRVPLSILLVYVPLWNKCSKRNLITSFCTSSTKVGRHQGGSRLGIRRQYKGLVSGLDGKLVSSGATPHSTLKSVLHCYTKSSRISALNISFVRKIRRLITKEEATNCICFIKYISRPSNDTPRGVAPPCR